MSGQLLLSLFLLVFADEPTPRPEPPDAPAAATNTDGNQTSGSSHTDADLPDGEADFVFELRSQGLFDLGRQVCLQRLQTARNLTLKARWELLFADCCEDEAWHLPQSRREDLISMAVARITEFLRLNSVQPDTELALRLRQLELLVATAEMECTAIAFRSSLPPDSQLNFARSACSQGIQLAAAQLKFTDELRASLPPATLRDIRFRLKCSLLELQLAEYRLSAPDKRSPATVLPTLRNEAEQLLRGLADQYVFRARHLLAQLLLESDDDAALELQLRSLAAQTSSAADRLQLEVLKQTRLLRLRRPSELLAGATPTATPLPTNNAADPELRMLQLHARLLLCELLSEIERQRSASERGPGRTPSAPAAPSTAAGNPASPAGSGSLAEAVTAFQTLKAELAPGLRGVWQERLQYCEQRFELVQLAGPDGADAIESVATLLAANNNAAALARLQQITQLPAAGRELKALARMQIGELLLRESRWDAAITELHGSAAEFAACGRPSQQAAADLLRLYGLAQVYRNTTAAPTASADPRPANKSQDIAASRYLTALNQHIETFADQPTIDVARGYRALLLRSSRPLEAAADLLAIPAPESGAAVGKVQQHLRKLALVGDCLLDASLRTAAPDPTATTPHAAAEERPAPPLPIQPAEIVAARATQIQPWLEKLHTAESPEHTILSLQLLSAPLLSPEFRPGDAVLDWETLIARLEPLLQSPAPAAAPSLPAAETVADSFDFSAVTARTLATAQTLRLLAASRLLLPQSQLANFQAALAQQSPAVRREQVVLLLPHLAEVQAPGNAFLAAFASGLLPSPNAPDRTPADLLRDLPVQLRLQQCGASSEAVTATLAALMRLPLSAEQLQEAATAISAFNPAGLGAAADSGATPAADFWRMVHRQTRSGEAAWFEASLQLATCAAANGRKAEAQRILRTVSAVHPTWGSTERQQRAAELLKSLERP
ncbi:MAG: hypothetical protein RLZZ436_1359 [Planctomycetota bacterium]|jgi:hypothetical protein